MDERPKGSVSLAQSAGSVIGLPAHGQRAAALGELHSRPHPVVAAPRLLVQLAFMTEGGAAVDAAVLSELFRRQGLPPPDQSVRYCSMKWGSGTLYWERHSEFSTYLWDGPPPSGTRWKDDTPFGEGFSPPGTVVSATLLEIREWEEDVALPRFDSESLCHSWVEDGKAAIVTDFRQDGDGMTRMLILNRSLSPSRLGALAKRLLEIETYRTFCMLGLPLAQSLSAQLRRMEDQLVRLTGEMRQAERRNSEALLADLTDLAAALEAQAASSLYRFGASRAYHQIVEERLDVLEEEAAPGADSWATFLRRRVLPAMRTCRSVEERQANLSRKLARANQLLRSWVDVEVERQNRDLLASMNNRARQQLRLQETVEGLSVAAVSYYVIGLLSYLIGGSTALLPHWMHKETAVALCVPLVVIAMWLVVRRIRSHHGDDPKPATPAKS